MASSSSQDETIQEEREELMVSPTGGIPTSRTAHFLKPTVDSIRAVPSLSFSSKPTISDFKKTQFLYRRYPAEKWKTWVDRLLPLHHHTWKKAGIYEAILGSTYNIQRHNDLIMKLAERWNVETNTFLFPFGEATVSLEDLMVLGGYSVLGDSVSIPLETNELIEIEHRMRKAHRELRLTEATRGANPHRWMDFFMESGTELEHEAFLALWLSRYVLLSSINYIRMEVFPLAIHLSKGTQLALAPVVLANLYRDLSSLKQYMIDSNKLGGSVSVSEYDGSRLVLRAPFQLVQVWAWERFPTLGPLPNFIKCGEPRLARWNGVKKAKVENVGLALDSAGECFQWRPYATVVNNGMLSKFYREKEEWVVVESCVCEEIESFARCLRVSELVGLGCIEQYLPHRVAMQFGLDQDLPGYVPRCNESSEAAWSNYNRPIKDTKIYIPPRLFESDLTTRYMEWWKQLMLAREDAIKGVVRQCRSRTYKRLPRTCWGNKEDTSAPPGFLSKIDVVEGGGCAEEDHLTVLEMLRRNKKHDIVENGLVGEVKPVGTNLQSSTSSQASVDVAEKIELLMKPVEMSMPRRGSVGRTKRVLEDQNMVGINNNEEEISKYGGNGLVGEVKPVGTNFQSSTSSEGSVDVAEKIELLMKPVEMTMPRRGSVGRTKRVLEDLYMVGINNNEEEINKYGKIETPGLELEARISKLEKVIAGLKAAKFGETRTGWSFPGAKFWNLGIVGFISDKRPMRLSCFSCCQTESRRSLKKSTREYEDTKALASFSNISFKSDSSKRRYIAEEIAKVGKGSISAQIFTFNDLNVATQNFNPESLIGEGGFGRVYKGCIENINQDVAVKQLDRNGFQGNREFLVEVLILSLLHHPNLVNLVGYCCDGDQRILVYEYMAKGSLEDHLLDLAPTKEPLDWIARMKIAEGAATGLEYLHETANPPVIYRDFKASNILLDEEFNPKLSDFGLAKLGPTDGKTHVSTRVMGTYGYCAPEYALTGQLTTKSDVYSFGVVFLEIITGRRVIDNSRPNEEQNLVIWAQPLFKDKSMFTLMADPKLEGNYPTKGLYQALAIAAMCLQEEASARPLISDVVTALEFLSTGKTVEANDEGAEEKMKLVPSGRNIVLEIEKDAPSGAWERD
ncbi:hypothetical protein ACSBR1_028850 [Camellia fascicularis]